MPDISLPDVHLPDIKLPDGLRDMNRRDIQSAINDRMPRKIEMPDVDLSKVELPKAVDDRLKTLEKRLDSIDLSKVPLPKVVEDRLPRKRRSNPFLPFAGDPRRRVGVRGRLVAHHLADSHDARPGDRRSHVATDDRSAAGGHAVRRR